MSFVAIWELAKRLPWGLIAAAGTLLAALAALALLIHTNHALTVQNSALTLQLDAEQQSHKRDVAALEDLQAKNAEVAQAAEDDRQAVKGSTDAAHPVAVPTIADALAKLRKADADRRNANSAKRASGTASR